MRILQIVTLSEVGGAQKVLFNIVAGLYKKGFEFHVACAPGGELVEWLQGLGVRVFEMPELVRPIKPFTDLKALMKLRKLIMSEKYDLVHCHSSKAGIVGRLAAWLQDVPRIVFTVHGWGVNSQQSAMGQVLLGTAERVAGWVSTDVVCVSKADYRLGKKFIDQKKLSVIYNGVERSEVRRGKLRQELGLSENDIVIAMAARLKKPKEPLLFLQVAEKLIKTQGDNIHFILVGDGPLRGECEDFIGERKLGGQVHLLGTREDLIDLYSDFNIFVLLSSWEGLPLTICEAMRAGLPVVASRVGGVEEQVVSGWNGFLVEVNNKDNSIEIIENAVEHLKKLILDQKLCREMGANSRMNSEEVFDVDRMVGEYGKMYLKQC
ncbi:MAG: glycosyltransferase family 4 protein [Dehalobacterium sp.]